MSINVAINGFGRIGRLVLRAALENASEDINVLAINDPAETKASAHLLKYDSVHGQYAADISVTHDNHLKIGDKLIASYHERDPEKLPWGDIGADIVLECSGRFTQRKDAEKHLKAGAKKVLISAPAKDEDYTVVYGVNHEGLKPEHKIISNASCTTNCLAPVAHVLHKSVGIQTGFMTTIHSYTGDQNIVDANHKDLHRARAGALNLIPTSTGAAKAVGKVLPDLNEKLDGVAIRVPTPNVSLVDFKFTCLNSTSVENINKMLSQAAENEMSGILGVYDAPLVSTDFNHDSRSSIVSLEGTKVMGDNFVRIMSWYDNEWGFSCRMIDTTRKMGQYL